MATHPAPPARSVRDAVDDLLTPGTVAASPAVPVENPFRVVGTDRHGDPIAKLVRPAGGRIIGGVAVGIADHLRVKVLWVRLTFAMLALLSGVGVLAYALLWIFVPQSRGAEPHRPSATERRQAIGIAAVGAALAVLGTALGLGQSVGWIVGPLGLASVGAAFIWREADDAQRQRWRRSAAGVVGETRSGLWRLVGGITLVVGGLAVFALGQFDVGATGGALVAVVLTLVGVAIIAIPWWIRLVRDLGAERREVVVQQERAEIAAHLHDSVLQTLALIQRQAADPREVLRLSRSQERELRAWLYGPAGYATSSAAAVTESDATVAAALATAAGEVEDTYAVKVTPVVVGDTAMGGVGSDMHALVAATREAMVNAAKHAGNPDISLYAEVEDDAVTVFVRDRGVGFDPDQVGSDRRGLAESIRGRMDRHHGRATVRSTRGEGTEIELSMPIPVRPAEPVASDAVAPSGAGPEPRQVLPR
ncbi:ATP-binding protein [Nakamurella deserti]|uniref:ATP-binding protein n=1 Tax=Nakamurella deserti TaxID=2164074 RepID=UPI000DBE0DE2|nr:ATP-binding protein [Nakamurella deserti]